MSTLFKFYNNKNNPTTIVKVGLLFQQLEWIWNIINDCYLDQMVCIVALDNNTARIAYNYLHSKTNKIVAVINNIFLLSAEMIFFNSILEFVAVGWSSTSLLTLLKSKYCSFGFSPEIVYDCVLFLEDQILRSYSLAYNTRQLALWVENYQGKVVKPQDFDNFFSKLLVVLKLLESWKVNNLFLDKIWTNHLEVASFIAGSVDWYKENINFINFVAEGNKSFNYDECISLAEYKNLIVNTIMHSFNFPIITENNLLVLCSLHQASSVNASAFFILNVFDKYLFNKVIWPIILNKQVIKNLDLTVSDDILNLEYLLSLIYCSKVYIVCSCLNDIPILLQNMTDVEILEISLHINQCSHYIAECPKPLLNMRPTEFSVSKLQSLLNNPYGFYVENILKLYRKSGVDLNLDNGINVGVIAHKLVDIIVSEKNFLNDDDVRRIVKKMISDLLGTNLILPKVELFIIPLLQKIICNFLIRHKSRLQENINIFGEISGVLSLYVNNRKVLIKTRCDRIEFNKDTGMIKIIDYKTGIIPTKKDCMSGMELQLPIAAFIALDGGFSVIGKKINGIDELAYWDLKKDRLYSIADANCLHNMLITIKNNLTCFLTDYLDENNGFYVKPRINRKYVITEHDSLSRINEESY